MTRYILVVDGEVQGKPEALPKTKNLIDGRSVSGFDRLSDDELADLGYYPVTEPEIDDRIQTLANLSYSFNGLSVETSVDIEPIGSVALAEAKILDIYEHARGLFNALTEQYSATERLFWADLEKEARAYQSSATVGPLMALDGRAPGQLASVIIAKADALRVAYANIISTRNLKVAEVNALNDPVQIVEYDHTLGW